MSTLIKRILIFIASVVVVGVLVNIIIYFYNQAQFTPLKKTSFTNITSFFVLQNNKIITQLTNGKILSNNTEILSANISPVSYGKDYFSIKGTDDQSFLIYSYEGKLVKNIQASKFRFVSENTYLYLQYTKNTASDFNFPAAKIFSGSVDGSESEIYSGQNITEVYGFSNNSLLLSSASDISSFVSDIYTINTTSKQKDLIASAEFVAAQNISNTSFVGYGAQRVDSLIIKSLDSQIQKNISVNVKTILDYKAPYLTYLRQLPETVESVELNTTTNQEQILTKFQTKEPIAAAQYKNGTYYLLTNQGELLEAKK